MKLRINDMRQFLLAKMGKFLWNSTTKLNLLGWNQQEKAIYTRQLVQKVI
jgi:hypothetical protein